MFIREFELIKEGEKSVRKLGAVGIWEPWFGCAGGYMDCWSWGARGVIRKETRWSGCGMHFIVIMEGLQLLIKLWWQGLKCEPKKWVAEVGFRIEWLEEMNLRRCVFLQSFYTCKKTFIFLCLNALILLPQFNISINNCFYALNITKIVS